MVQTELRYPRLLSYDVGKLRAHYDGLRALGGLTGPLTPLGGLPGPLTPLLLQHPQCLLLVPPAAVAARTTALALLFEAHQAVVVQMVWRNPVFLAKSAGWVQATLAILTQAGAGMIGWTDRWADCWVAGVPVGLWRKQVGCRPPRAPFHFG